VNTIGGPDIKTTVELEQDQERHEDAGNTSDVGGNQEVLGGSAEVVVELVHVDVHSEEDGGEHHHDVVAHQLLGDGVVKRWRSWRGGVELVEWMNQQLRWRQKQVDCHQTEQLSCRKYSCYL